MEQAKQAKRKEKHEEQPLGNIEMKEALKAHTSTCSSSTTSGSKNGVSFKFNAHAPEFVPRSRTRIPISSCGLHPGGSGVASGSSDHRLFVGGPERVATTCLVSNKPSLSIPQCSSISMDVLTDDLRIKIVKQVEYKLSDMSLLANESLSKQISKDPEGYVPISFIVSTKKIKSLVNANPLLAAQALESSTKLVVSGDGQKVRRKHPFTEKDREEVQSRTVVVENLPENHSHQNLDKIFNVVGSVKNIRICHPQESSSPSSKIDFTKRNKPHALVEFDSSQIAEEAVEKLNDERNWRKILGVRLLLGLTPKSVLDPRKSEFDGILDEDDSLLNENSDDSSQPNKTESNERNAEAETEHNSAVGSKKGKGKGRGKGRGGRIQNNKLSLSPQLNNAFQCEASAKYMSKGPRMPDGTKGFTMGRGKPLTSPSN